MSVGVVKPERLANNKGFDVFQQNVLPFLLQHDGVQSIEYDRSEYSLAGDSHYLLSYVGRYRRGRRIKSELTTSEHDTVFLPHQELLTFDPESVTSQVIPYVHDILPATTTFAGPIPTALARQYVANLGNCNLVLCASNQTKDDLVFRTPFSNQAEVVYQGITSNSSYGNQPTEYDLLYVGSLIERKQPSFLRRCITAAMERGYRCVAVTPSDSDLPCDVLTDIEEEELKQLYARSRFYLHPSKQEGFGRPPVEAQASGTPVMALDNPINNEILGVEGEAWLAVDSVEDVVDVLETDSSRYSSLVAGAEENATRFDWEQTRRQIAAYLFDSS